MARAPKNAGDGGSSSSGNGNGNGSGNSNTTTTTPITTTTAVATRSTEIATSSTALTKKKKKGKDVILDAYTADKNPSCVLKQEFFHDAEDPALGSSKVSALRKERSAQFSDDRITTQGRQESFYRSTQ